MTTQSFPLGAMLAVMLAGGSANAQPASDHFTGHQLAAHAKISLAKAREIALRARPGSITDQELEKERGGSGLRYSFDVLSAGKSYEVGVDAKSGAILENGQESASVKAAEAVADQRTKH